MTFNLGPQVSLDHVRHADSSEVTRHREKGKCNGRCVTYGSIRNIASAGNVVWGRGFQYMCSRSAESDRPEANSIAKEKSRPWKVHCFAKATVFSGKVPYGSAEAAFSLELQKDAKGDEEREDAMKTRLQLRVSQPEIDDSVNVFRESVIKTLSKVIYSSAHGFVDTDSFGRRLREAFTETRSDSGLQDESKSWVPWLVRQPITDEFEPPRFTEIEVRFQGGDERDG